MVLAWNSMVRLTTLFVALLIFLASAQCFASCMERPCHQTQPCHSKVKACSHQELLADDIAASADDSPYIAPAILPIVRIAEPVFSANSFAPQPLISPPSVASLSVTVLKI
jgi:hypothetical protein